jgi:hypothetical protein
MTVELKTHTWDGAENLETEGDVRLMESDPIFIPPFIHPAYVNTELVETREWQ